MKKLFTNDKFFLAMVLCAVLGGAVYLASYCCFMPASSVPSQIPVIIRALCVLFLYSSYKKHSKNVMKGLIGALLMAQMLSAISNLSTLSLHGEEIVAIIFLVLSVVLFISHFYINSEHHSKPGMIKLNQYLCVAYLLDIVAWNILWIVADRSALSIICCLGSLTFIVGMASAVVCVESRLDAYRLDREAAGWTEEKGYPENYVHEYEKK